MKNDSNRRPASTSGRANCQVPKYNPGTCRSMSPASNKSCNDRNDEACQPMSTIPTASSPKPMSPKYRSNRSRSWPASAMTWSAHCSISQRMSWWASPDRNTPSRVVTCSARPVNRVWLTRPAWAFGSSPMRRKKSRTRIRGLGVTRNCNAGSSTCRIRATFQSRREAYRYVASISVAPAARSRSNTLTR